MFFVKSVYLFIYLFILTKLPRISIFLLIYATLQIRTVISQKMKYNFEARFCKIARLQDFIDNTQTHKCVTWGHNIYTVLHGEMIIYYQKH